MAENEPTLEDIREAAQRAGLAPTEQDLAKLRLGAARFKRWTEANRAQLTPDVEPATTFTAGETR